MSGLAQKKEWEFQRAIREAREAKEKKPREEGSQALLLPPAAPPAPAAPLVAPSTVPVPVQEEEKEKAGPLPRRSERALQKAKMKKIYGQPTGTVVHDRLPIFAPTRRPEESTLTIENSWGTGKVIGKIGQNHRNLHDLIMTKGLEYRQGAERELYVLVDPYALAKDLLPNSQPNLEYLLSLLEDMRKAQVTVNYQRKGERSLGGIISEVFDKHKKISEFEGPGGVILEQYHWMITISRTWMLLYDEFLNVRKSNALEIIRAMTSGYSMSLAQFMLDNKHPCEFTLEFVRKTLGINVLAKHFKQEIAKDAERLANLGISIEGQKIRYVPKKGLVSFWNPSKKQ